MKDFIKNNKKLLIGSGFTVVILFLFAYFNKNKQINKWLQACKSAFGTLNLVQINAIREIIKAWEKYGDGDTNKLIYILATARHESNFKPIKERRASPQQTRVYNLQNRYWHTGYYGRGFVQLTHQRNYGKMSNLIGVNLVKNPSLALTPKYAAEILVRGMLLGAFTRKKLNTYINQNQIDFYAARKTVNGLDRASLIRDYAQKLKTNYFKN